MISSRWIGVILWSLAGLVTLLTPGKVSKISYTLIWIMLMFILVTEAIGV